MVVKGLVEEVADGGSYAEFGEIEEAQEVLQRAGEADEVGSKGVKEYFT